MTYRSYKRLAWLLVAVVAMLLLPTQQTYADNSKEAKHVMVCIAVYHGEPFRAEMAILDSSFNEQSMRTMMVDRWLLPEIAGKYNHEYFDYPNPPKSVHVSDLDSLKCKTAEGNAPQEP